MLHEHFDKLICLTIIKAIDQEVYMGINSVWIEEGCIACGNCEAVCPEVFELTDFSHVRVDADLTQDKEIRQAAEECPTQVIKFTAN